MPMPALTEERRRDLTKVVRGEAENAPRGGAQYPPRCQQRLQKPAERQVHHRGRRAPRRDDIQKLTDKYIVEVDKALAEKERN